MNTPTKPFRLLFRALLFGGAFLFLIHSTLYPGSATWSANPITSHWNTVDNWPPATIPNGPDDQATFGATSTKSLSLSADVEVNTIQFDPGARPYFLTIAARTSMTISGAGIVNNSGASQTIQAAQE